MEYVLGQWIFRNKLHVYPVLGYRPWPRHDITGQWQCLSIDVQQHGTHDLTSPVPVARTVERWIEMDNFDPVG